MIFVVWARGGKKRGNWEKNRRRAEKKKEIRRRAKKEEEERGYETRHTLWRTGVGDSNDGCCLEKVVSVWLLC